MSPPPLRDTIRALRPFLIVAAGVFAVGVLIGFVRGSVFPEATATIGPQIEALVAPLRALSPVQIFLIIVVNNIVKILAMTFLGILLGVIPVAFLLLNGVILQIVAAKILATSGPLVVAAGLLPHGVIEIAAALLGAAMGLRLGVSAVRRLSRREVSLRPALREAWWLHLRLLLPMLIAAAAIEVWITPALILIARQ